MFTNLLFTYYYYARPSILHFLIALHLRYYYYYYIRIYYVIFHLYIYTLLLLLIPLLHTLFILTIYRSSLPLYRQAIHSVHYYIQRQQNNSISPPPSFFFVIKKKITTGSRLYLQKKALYYLRIVPQII